MLPLFAGEGHDLLRGLRCKPAAGILREGHPSGFIDRFTAPGRRPKTDRSDHHIAFPNCKHIVAAYEPLVSPLDLLGRFYPTQMFHHRRISQRRVQQPTVVVRPRAQGDHRRRLSRRSATGTAARPDRYYPRCKLLAIRSISSAACTPLALASYARCVERICIIASTIATLERSSIPKRTLGSFPAPASTYLAAPDCGVAANSVPPAHCSRSGAGNSAIRIRPTLFVPWETVAVRGPSSPTETVSVPD